MNTFDMMTEALDEARATMNCADRMANKMAHILRGRLRNVAPYNLKALKKEIKNFNSHTGEWKDGC